MSSHLSSLFRRGLPHACCLFICVVLMLPSVGSSHELRGPAAGAGRMSSASEGPCDLAARYENGESVPKDQHRALQLYCQAARGGDARAFLSVAWAYLNGRGVARDDNAAAFWLRKAASRQVPQATNLLHLLGSVAPIDRGCADPIRSPAISVEPSQKKIPVAPAAVGREIRDVAQEAGLSPKLVSSIASVESAFHPAAVSPKGAVGVMQLMPATARRFQVADRFDYRENIRGGAAYVRFLLSKFNGNLDLVLAAYNAGEGAVAAHGGVPPFRETQAFVRSVKQRCGCSGTDRSVAGSRGSN